MKKSWRPTFIFLLSFAILNAMWPAAQAPAVMTAPWLAVPCNCESKEALFCQHCSNEESNQAYLYCISFIPYCLLMCSSKFYHMPLWMNSNCQSVTKLYYSHQFSLGAFPLFLLAEKGYVGFKLLLLFLKLVRICWQGHLKLESSLKNYSTGWVSLVF